MNDDANDALNGDFSKAAVLRTDDMDWVQSPSPTVWRKRLEHTGPAEAGRVTSLVRFEPGARFAAHDHPDGEEILVLEGVFSDHTGDWGPGSFLLNPEGFHHAPWSDEGCLLFVKLRQYGGDGRKLLALDTEAMDWQPQGADGRRIKPLYRQDGFAEEIRLVELAAGTTIAAHDHAGGEEVFVLSGSISDDAGTYPTGSWLRLPDGSRHAPWSDTGCRIYVRTGHLPPQAG